MIKAPIPPLFIGLIGAAANAQTADYNYKPKPALTVLAMFV